MVDRQEGKEVSTSKGRRTLVSEFSLGSESVVISETRVCRQEEQKKRKSSSNRQWQSWQE